jgi:hypothetical protein
VHPTATVFHRRRLAWAVAARPRPASWRLLAFAAVAIERIEQSRIGAGELVRRLGKFAELRGLWPVVGSHAMARTHMISNQHTSPIALAKSTAIGRKAIDV